MICIVLGIELAVLLLAVCCLVVEVSRLRKTWESLEWQLELNRLRLQREAEDA